MKFTWLKLIIMFFAELFKKVQPKKNKKNDQPLPIPFVGDDFTPETPKRKPITRFKVRRKILNKKNSSYWYQNRNANNCVYQIYKWGHLGGRSKEEMEFY